VPTALRASALDHGARAVSSRVLVGAIRAAGLRRRGRREPWHEGRITDPEVAPTVAWLGEQWPGARELRWTTALWRHDAVGLSALLPGATLAGAGLAWPRALDPCAFAVARPEGVVVDVVVARLATA
jgi:hypothetical protein